MGWFSADEVIAPTISNAPEKSDTVQTVALCILAAVAACYVGVKVLLKLHKHHTERLAERAARRVVVPV